MSSTEIVRSVRWISSRTHTCVLGDIRDPSELWASLLLFDDNTRPLCVKTPKLAAGPNRIESRVPATWTILDSL